MSDVPCNGCTACCKHDDVYLRPEEDPRDYLVEPGLNALTGEVGWRLQHKPRGGGCIYLGDGGCTIHDRAPAICKRFDCRFAVAMLDELPRPIRRRMLRLYGSKGIYGPEVRAAAKARMDGFDFEAAGAQLAEEMGEVDLDSPLSKFVRGNIL